MYTHAKNKFNFVFFHSYIPPRRPFLSTLYSFFLFFSFCPVFSTNVCWKFNEEITYDVLVSFLLWLHAGGGGREEGIPESCI